jgi:hypothetical protein
MRALKVTLGIVADSVIEVAGIITFVCKQRNLYL